MSAVATAPWWVRPGLDGRDGRLTIAGEDADIVAVLNAGGYHQAMSSTHCLRPTGTAIFLDR